MTSADPHYILDDDFDWEAAARAVDAVTHSTSSSYFAPPPPPFPPKPTTSRQTILDRFIRKPAPKPQPEILDSGDYRVSSVQIDPEKAKTWLYPVNFRGRDYQFAITKTALFNTLVALPTGLGKTLIAAVVMYNYFRWFPEGHGLVLVLVIDPCTAVQRESLVSWIVEFVKKH